MITFNKGAWFVVGLVLGLAVGSGDAGPEIRTLWENLRSSASTLANTAGSGAQDVGGWVEE
ncbi:MAG: hypothetical protein ACR2RF_33140 [Geminicoccaceae bacterium]